MPAPTHTLGTDVLRVSYGKLRSRPLGGGIEEDLDPATLIGHAADSPVWVWLASRGYRHPASTSSAQ